MIVFDRVTKQFSDHPPAVEEVCFTIERGEFVFFTGHSGSGKTTLLKLLTREYILTDGEIEFEGERLSRIRSGRVHHHRRNLGVVYQDYRLLSELNVWENIALALEIIGKPRYEIEERVTDLLDLVQLSDKAFFFPAELSGGESQRVGIARALATAPNVILADEPTGNLDADNSLMIARLFSKIHELGTTVLFATHDRSVLDHLGHRRITMEKGRLVSDEPSTRSKPLTKNTEPRLEPQEQADEPSEPDETPRPAPPIKHSAKPETKHEPAAPHHKPEPFTLDKKTNSAKENIAIHIEEL